MCFYQVNSSQRSRIDLLQILLYCYKNLVNITSYKIKTKKYLLTGLLIPILFVIEVEDSEQNCEIWNMTSPKRLNGSVSQSLEESF